MSFSDPVIPLTRTAATEALGALDWRYLLASFNLSVAVGSLDQSVIVASAVLAASGNDADGHLRIDLRPDRVELSVQTRAIADVTGRDVEIARRISQAISAAGVASVAATATDENVRPVQNLELAIDAVDIEAVRPFWRAVMAYTDAVGGVPGDRALVDPAGQLPTIWFQQMDDARPERNRIHLDITVAHDEVDGRLTAALAAGGRMVNDRYARSFWVLADAEGNEACICTWTERDEREQSLA